MESMNNANKTLIHISHLHPLKLIASLEPKPICHACGIPCGDQSFGCIECRYFLHVMCATTKRSLDHPAHPAHTLTFELTPCYTTGKFQCDACGNEGSTFGLRCRECDYDLHLHCTALPHIVNHPSHSHPLSIVYQNRYPYGTGAIFCDLCKNYLDPCKWFYLCRSCNFGGHIGCFSGETLEVLSPGLQAPPTLPLNHQGAQANILVNTVNSMKQEQLLFAQAKAAQTMMVGSARLVNSFQWGRR